MEITIEIQDLSRGGPGVGRDASGKVVFVPFSAPGDLLRVEVQTEDKRYSEGKILEILKPSEQRISPRCPAFGQCGGCEWQHIPYELQWNSKVKSLKHTLARLGMKTDLPWMEFPADNPWNYRNRIQLRGDSEKLGFFARKSKSIVPVEECFIARQELNAQWKKIREEGMNRPPYKVELEVFEDGETTATWNASHSAQGFRQVFDAQNLKLQNWAQEKIQGSEILLDLYGGSGNLSRALVNRFSTIHCVDIGSPFPPPSGTPENFHFHRSFVLPWLRKNAAELKAQSKNISVILDPPREGLGEDLIPIIEILKTLPTIHILAVGCEPDPWARLIHRLERHGWQISEFGALDFFPQTHHVEALAVLTKKS